MNTPLTSKFKEYDLDPVVDGTNKSDESTLYFTIDGQSSVSSLPIHGESLVPTVRTLSALVDSKICGFVEQIQQYDIKISELQKQLNKKQVELQQKLDSEKLFKAKEVEWQNRINEKDTDMHMAKLRYEAQLVELKNAVEEAKKKKWCNHCWNEVTFNCVIDTPACSIHCLNELMKSTLSPAYSISSDSSDSSVESVHDESMEQNCPKNNSLAVNGTNGNGISKFTFYQNGNGVSVNENNNQLTLISVDEYTPPDLASLIRDLED